MGRDRAGFWMVMAFCVALVSLYWNHNDRRLHEIEERLG